MQLQHTISFLKMSRIIGGGEKKGAILWCEKECQDLKTNFNSLTRFVNFEFYYIKKNGQQLMWSNLGIGNLKRPLDFSTFHF